MINQYLWLEKNYNISVISFWVSSIFILHNQLRVAKNSVSKSLTIFNAIIIINIIISRNITWLKYFFIHVLIYVVYKFCCATPHLTKNKNAFFYLFFVKFSFVYTLSNLIICQSALNHTILIPDKIKLKTDLGYVHTWRLFWLEKVDKSAFLVK